MGERGNCFRHICQLDSLEYIDFFIAVNSCLKKGNTKTATRIIYKTVNSRMLQAKDILQNHYQLNQKLGDNVARQTWLATDLAASNSDSQVVVKLLTFGGQIQWENLKLFEREAQILKQLNHPQIPKYQDYFCIDDRLLWFGLVEDYIPGASFKDLLNQGKRFTEEKARRIAVDILNILVYLHELNPPVLHRDIKPSNLILGEDEQIYLVDFGAVQDKAATEGATFTVVGTYGYTPMEQFGGRAVAASDLYALGATLIHLLTGTAPADLPQRDLRIQFSDRVTLSPNFINWLEKLTEPAPERRFNTASQALDALKSGIVLNHSSTSQQLQPSLPLNNSGCGLFDTSQAVPDEIKGWNWGAFLLSWLWGPTNLIPWFWGSAHLKWLGLLSWGWMMFVLVRYALLVGTGALVMSLGLLMAVSIALGIKGNDWAWKSRRWRSIERFKAHQRGWAIAGILLGIPFLPTLWLYTFLLIFSKLFL